MRLEEVEHLFTYHAPTPDSIDALQVIRNHAKEFCLIIDSQMPDCADKSACVRKLRELVMAINAGIVLNQKIEDTI